MIVKFVNVPSCLFSIPSFLMASFHLFPIHIANTWSYRTVPFPRIADVGPFSIREHYFTSLRCFHFHRTSHAKQIIANRQEGCTSTSIIAGIFSTDSWTPSGKQLKTFLHKMTTCNGLTQHPGVSMESLSLLQCGSTTFKDEVATLVGQGDVQFQEKPGTTLKCILRNTGCQLIHTGRVVGTVPTYFM